MALAMYDGFKVRHADSSFTIFCSCSLLMICRKALPCQWIGAKGDLPLRYPQADGPVDLLSEHEPRPFLISCLHCIDAFRFHFDLGTTSLLLQAIFANSTSSTANSAKSVSYRTLPPGVAIYGESSYLKCALNTSDLAIARLSMLGNNPLGKGLPSREAPMGTMASKSA